MTNVDEPSIALARRGLLGTAILAGAGSCLGAVAVQRGGFAPMEAGLILSSGVAAAAMLVTVLLFRKAPLQHVASGSTAFYTGYLLVGMAISLSGKGHPEHLFVYLLWFFPLLVFNKMVNSPFVGRFQAWIILAAPFVALGCLSPRIMSFLAADSRMLVAVYCVSYSCFALTLNVVTRFREAYILERGRANSLRVEAEILESISDCFISLDSGFRLVYLNDAACAEFAITRREALLGKFYETVPGFFSDVMLSELLAATGRPVSSAFEAQDRNGRWFEMRCFPRPDGVSVYFRNTTDAVLSRQRLEAANASLREKSELLDQTQDAIFVQDMQGHILYWNKGAERLFGWTAEEVTGRAWTEVFRLPAEGYQEALDQALKDGIWTGEVTKSHKDGRTLVVDSRSVLVRSADGEFRSILCTNTDITHRKAAEAKIEHLAFYDTLTGLPNRFLLQQHLEKALADSLLNEQTGALIFIDLDDFKTLNDTAGHETGDLLLKEAGIRLKASVRRGDSVARLGGDEFVVVLEGLGKDEKRAALTAKVVGSDILRALKLPYLLRGYEYHGTASIGITCFPKVADGVEDLLKRADLAMYQSKAQGRNTLCMFDPGLETMVAARAALQADLRQALGNQEFELQYQPQVDADGQVTGAEALLRWKHPRRGMVPPDEFIPLAEEAGLIVELGEWVLRTACAQLGAWRKRPGFEALSIAVNVSNRQFVDSHFVYDVETALERSDVDPGLLMLEITESSAMEKVSDTIGKMSALKARGVSFSLDDFGTGYSSLSQLKKIPLDELKIDKSFVRDVLDGVMDASIVRTIISLGRNLGLRVIAEGVETKEQRAFLKEHGCVAYQGYLFSPALRVAEFESYVVRINELVEQGVA